MSNPDMSMPELQKTEFDGKKALLRGDHPWAGETGIILGMQMTGAGWAVKVRMDNGIECFVYHTENLKLV
jgi:hypothetical protein